MNKKLRVPALVALLMAVNTGAVSALTDSDMEICLAVAKRQAQMYDAKINSDWPVIYALLTDEYRAQTSYEEFVANPNISHEERAKRVSGAKTPGDPKNRGYMPPHLGYRLTDFYISKDKKMVKAVSRITLMAPQFVGPITRSHPDEEYWIKTGPDRILHDWTLHDWKAQWDTKYLIHASGAATSHKTPKLPEFTTRVKAADLARLFVEEAAKLPEGKKRDAALEKAIAVDVFAVAETLAEKKGAGPLRQKASKQIVRQMLANPTATMYFEQMMEAGRWLGMAGDHESSYRYYRTALGLDPFREDALAALSNEAMRLGRFEEAAGHYIDLLKLAGITDSRQSTLLEQQIDEECALCEKLAAGTKIEIAKNLVNARKWKTAYRLFSSILQESGARQKTAAKLEAGKRVKVPDAVGEKIAGIAGEYTFDELGRLLRAGGMNLYHTGDMPKNFRFIKGSLTIESVPKIQRTNYKSFYKMNWLPARAVIKWSGMKSLKELTTHGGYLAVTLKKNSAPARKFYHDAAPTAAGNEQLVKDIKGLKRGESIILARVSFLNVRMEKSLQAALPAIGVDVGLLRGSVGAQIIIGTKGMPTGGAKVYSGKHAIRKVFTPPNMVDVKMMKAPALAVTGSGENATVKYIPPKK